MFRGIPKAPTVFYYILTTKNSLTDLKKALVSHRAHPPTSLRIDWKSEDLLSKLTRGLPTPIQPPAQGLRFDVIVISEKGGRHNFSEITQLDSLPIESLAAAPSFLFLWLPSSDLLEVGRALLKKWGFRRAEDIVWVKTNHAEIQRWKSGGMMPLRTRRKEDSQDAVFVRTKEHCLMGIRGTVRRSVTSSLQYPLTHLRLTVTLSTVTSILMSLLRKEIRIRIKINPRSFSTLLRTSAWVGGVLRYLATRAACVRDG